MYCPSCGAEYTIELKYCNRCGANLSTNLVPQIEPVIVSVTKPTLIISVVLLLITVGGFGGLVGIAANIPLNEGLWAIIMLGMLTILIIDIFLVRLLSKLIGTTLSSIGQPKVVQQTVPGVPGQFQSPTKTAHLQATPSVTENTTRFLEEAYRAPAEPQATGEKRNL